MLGNYQDLIHVTRQHLQSEIDLKTQTFSEHQRALTIALTGASMADLIWGSDTNPNAEKKWALPKVAREVASTIVDAATRVSATRDLTDEEVKNFSASPNLRKIAAETKTEVLNHLDRRARGH
jgi:hypothetical protein